MKTKNIHTNYTNHIKIEPERGLVTKTYRPSLFYLGLSSVYPIEHLSPETRLDLEFKKLTQFRELGLCVPEILDINRPKLQLVTKFVDAENMINVTKNRDLSPDKKLTAIESCARFLRELHEAGEYSANANIQNFGLERDDSGRVWKFDEEFDYSPDLGTGAQKENMDLYEFTWTAVQGMRHDIPKRDTSLVLDAVNSRGGYGSLPEFVDTIWAPVVFMLKLRPDLYMDLQRKLKKG